MGRRMPGIAQFCPQSPRLFTGGEQLPFHRSVDGGNGGHFDMVANDTHSLVCLQKDETNLIQDSSVHTRA